MGSFLQQLENNEAVMLVYLTGELPIEDRLEFEQMLAADPKLRAALEDFRSAHEAVFDQLTALDKAAPLSVSTDVAMRQISRVMKQRQVEKLIRQASPAPRRRRRIPRWAYAGASVAAAMFAVIVWWGVTGDWTPRGSVAINSADSSEQLDPSQEEQAQLMEMTLRNNGEEISQIQRAEMEVASFVHAGDTGPTPASVFGSADQNQ